MFRIFRIIRQKLLADGRFAKYLLYATGEFVLIVAGILFALRIDNWNNDRNDEKKTNAILCVVQEDISNDLQEMEKVIQHYELIKKNIELFLADSLSEDEFCKKDGWASYLIAFPDWDINKRGFNLIQKLENKHIGDSLISEITKVYGLKSKLIELMEEKLSENNRTNLVYYSDNFDWFANWMIGRPDSTIAHQLYHSISYKNKLSIRHLYNFGNYLPTVKEFNQDLIGLETKLTKRLSGN